MEPEGSSKQHFCFEWKRIHVHSSWTQSIYSITGVLQVILGALPMAVDAVNNDSTLLPGKTLRYIAHDIGRDSTSSIAIKYV